MQQQQFILDHSDKERIIQRAKATPIPPQQVRAEARAFLNRLCKIHTWKYDIDQDAAIDRATLRHVNPDEKGKLGPQGVLQRLATQISEEKYPDSYPLDKLVLLGGCVVAKRCEKSIDTVGILQICFSGGSRSIAGKTASMQRLNLLLYIMEKYMGTCAYEIPLRQYEFSLAGGVADDISTTRVYSRAHFDMFIEMLFKEEDTTKPYIPIMGNNPQSPNYERLKPHNLIADLFAGEFT
ncbi:hypothetical protein BGZ63DRAFT_403895 [Mariannaea sp. PMI_226]|nr:hypothetical protein BGZ63DRAFT_403895 [Mariannaea sp. PMI_226]